MSSTPATFEEQAQRFNDHLGYLFAETVTEHPLDPIVRANIAFISFQGVERHEHRPSARPSVELRNGCRIRVSQTLLPNPEAPSGITTADYVYQYALGPNDHTDWLARYEYEPFKPTNKYPVPHVHFNGNSEAYDRFPVPKDKPLKKLHFPTDRITVQDFIEHLIIEFDTPTHCGKEAALKLLSESRKAFHEQHRTRRAPYETTE